MRPTRSILWLLIPIAFAFRLAYAVTRELVPDEAFYWVLSRHPSAGYLDHPPMVAYIIKLGTMLFGSNELGVRIGAAAMAFGALLVLLSLSRRMIGERATLWLAIIWLISPLFAGLATIMTPDTPAIFFSMCALACAVRIFRTERIRTEDSGLRTERNTSAFTQSSVLSPQSSLKLWLLFGYFTGLAMVSKYTAVLPAGAVVLALLTSVEGRRELRRPGIWLAALVALLVFSPVIYWNATHQWASFKFQLHHGLDEVDVAESSGGQWVQSHFGSLFKYLVGQVGFFTPVFFIFGVVILAIRWWNYRELSPAYRMLLWSATIPLLFFGFTAFTSAKPGEGNWPAFGYFPMSLLMMEHIARRWKPFDIKWLKIGCGVALVITIALHSPDGLFWALKKVGAQDRFPRKLNQFFGWRQMARVVDRSRGDSVLVAGTHQDAAELSFYLPGQPDVWVFPIHDAAGHPVSRPTAFDYFPGRPDLSKAASVLFFMGRVEDFCNQYGFARASTSNDTFLLHGRWRERRFDVCVHK